MSSAMPRPSNLRMFEPSVAKRSVSHRSTCCSPFVMGQEVRRGRRRTRTRAGRRRRTRGKLNGGGGGGFIHDLVDPRGPPFRRRRLFVRLSILRVVLHAPPWLLRRTRRRTEVRVRGRRGRRYPRRPRYPRRMRDESRSPRGIGSNAETRGRTSSGVGSISRISVPTVVDPPRAARSLSSPRIRARAGPLARAGPPRPRRAPLPGPRPVVPRGARFPRSIRVARVSHDDAHVRGRQDASSRPSSSRSDASSSDRECSSSPSSKKIDAIVEAPIPAGPPPPPPSPFSSSNPVSRRSIRLDDRPIFFRLGARK